MSPAMESHFMKSEPMNKREENLCTYLIYQRSRSLNTKKIIHFKFRKFVFGLNGCRKVAAIDTKQTYLLRFGFRIKTHSVFA